jgi:hypothetical protein
MLHPDSERRIVDIQQMANLFEEKKYHRTATKILTFVEILKGKTVPSDFLKRLDAVFDIFQEEFVNELPVGGDYRKRCFEEIKRIVLEAIGRMHPDFAKTLLVIYPFLHRLNEANKVTGAIADELARKQIKDKLIVFHLRCYGYLILVEGIFDELARMLFFLKTVSKTNIPSNQDLERLTVWKILDLSKPTPVFLENWEEKNHIRNSIGHSRTEYDPKSDTARFIDIDNKKGNAITYDSGIIKMSEFAEKALELEDSLASFYYVLILLRIYDFIISENPYPK